MQTHTHTHTHVYAHTHTHMPFTTSDHNTIHFELLTPNHSSVSSAHSSDINTSPKLDFAKTNHAGLSACLLSTDWHLLFSPSDPIDVAWENFSRYICSLIVRFTPLRKQFTHNKSNSIPLNIRRLIRLKRAAWLTYKKHKCLANRKIFYRLAKTVRVSLLAHRKAHEESILNNGSIRQFFAYTHSRMSSNTSIGPITNSAGAQVTQDREKAEIFNDFFHSVYTQDDGLSPAFNPRTNKIISTPVFSVDDVRRS